jgi:hypothetical protein
MASVTIEQARAAKAKLRDMLSGHDAVNGIGIGAAEEGYAVAVNLLRPLTADERIPEEIDGVPVRTRIVGSIRKLSA